MMKEQVVVAPKFRTFSLLIFSQASQNIAVKVRVDRSVRRNKLTVNSPHHAEKETMSMLFVALRTCRAFLALDDCGLFHCDDCCFVFGS
jgi:hypothetical protein